MNTKTSWILLAVITVWLPSAPSLGEAPPHNPPASVNPKTGHPAPASPAASVNKADACALVQGPSASVSEIAGPGPTRPKLPDSKDPQFIELYKGLSKCGPCHEVSIQGDSLQNVKFAFTGGRGRMGEVNAHEIINALKNITEMNNVKLTPSERAAIVAWSKVK